MAASFSGCLGMMAVKDSHQWPACSMRMFSILQVIRICHEKKSWHHHVAGCPTVINGIPVNTYRGEWEIKEWEAKLKIKYYWSGESLASQFSRL